MVFFGSIAIDRRYRLRWRFDFADKPTKTGIWNNSGGQQKEGFGSSAWCVNKTGLVRAAVEAENQQTWEVSVLAECDGWDFVNFAWIATTPAPFMLGALDALEIQGQVTGLVLETRELNHRVRVDGSQQIVQKTAADKAIHLAGFGK